MIDAQRLSWVAPDLFHPLALASVGLLLLNDHVLKLHWPGVLTGKLSDVVGLVFFPLLLAALVEAPRWLRASYQPSRAIVLIAIIVTGSVFTAINLWEGADGWVERGFGVLQWIVFRQPWTGSSPETVVLTRDPTDLVALPMLLVAWRLGVRR